MLTKILLCPPRQAVLDGGFAILRCVHPSSFGDRCVWGLEFQTGPANVGAVVDDDDRH